MSEADKWLSQLKLAIDQPYPETVAEFAGWMHSEELETHLLHTPRRKTVLLMDQTGDYEYDEEMTLDGELELASQVDQFYAQVCQKISEFYGAPLDLDLEDPSLQARIEPEDYDDDAERASYLSGAYYDGSDDGDASFWQSGSDYICVQKIKKWGDGNFQYYVIATVTPREDV